MQWRYNGIIPVPYIHLREMKKMFTEKKFTWVFLATLFPIARKLRPFKYLSIDNWINKMWSTHAVEDCYSAMFQHERVSETLCLVKKKKSLVMYGSVFIKCKGQAKL